MDPKARILARRSALIATALVAAACETPPAEPPHVCLSVSYVPDAGPPAVDTASPDASTVDSARK